MVSEERGTISMAFQGRLLQGLDAQRLTRYLTTLSPKEGILDAWRRILAQLDGNQGQAAQEEPPEEREEPARI